MTISHKPRNISWGDGSPVEFLADSPHLMILDRLTLVLMAAQSIPALLADNPRDALLTILDEDETSASMGIALYEIPDFSPGPYRLDVESICKMGDEVDISDEAWEERGHSLDDEQIELRYFSVDTGCIVIVDFDHLKRLGELLTDGQIDAACRAKVDDYGTFVAINAALGGPYYALILSPGEPYAFDGDGTYTLQKRAVKSARP